MLTAIAVLAVVLSFAGAVPYIRAIRAGTTTPHPVTWTVWAALTTTGFAAQLAAGGGIGSVSMGASAAISSGIAVVAFRRRRAVWARSDLLSICGVVAAVAAWVITSDPLVAVVLVACADVIAFAPTVRKTWKSPHSEALPAYVFGAASHVCALITFDTRTLTTMLYPAVIIAVNTMFVTAIALRRRHHGGDTARMSSDSPQLAAAHV
jgi:hypothetical protein